MTPLCGDPVEEPSTCGTEGSGWEGAVGLDSSVASLDSGL